MSKYSDIYVPKRVKINAAWVAGRQRRIGKLIPKPCEVCGTTNVQMHHEDYSKPLDVKWVCRKHHMEIHKRSRQKTWEFQRILMWLWPKDYWSRGRIT